MMGSANIRYLTDVVRAHLINVASLESPDKREHFETRWKDHNLERLLGKKLQKEI